MQFTLLNLNLEKYFLLPDRAYIGVGRAGDGVGGQGPPNNLRGGPTYPMPHIFFQFLCERGKNHKCTVEG